MFSTTFGTIRRWRFVRGGGVVLRSSGGGVCGEVLCFQLLMGPFPDGRWRVTAGEALDRSDDGNDLPLGDGREAALVWKCRVFKY